jgi:hypothetical protein
MLHVVSTDGWEQMRWDRLPRVEQHWHVHTVDTTALDPAATAKAVLTWVRGTLAGTIPTIRVTD